MPARVAKRWDLASTGHTTGTQLHAVFEHAVDTTTCSSTPWPRSSACESHHPGRFDFFSPGEIDRLISAAAAGLHRDPSRPAVSETGQALRSFEDEQTPRST